MRPQHIDKKNATYPANSIRPCYRCALSRDDLPDFNDVVPEANTRSLLFEAAWKHFTGKLLLRDCNVSRTVAVCVDDCIGAVELVNSERLFELGISCDITLDFKH